MTPIDGVGVWVVDFEGCDRVANAIEALLLVCFLSLEPLEEFFVVFRTRSRRFFDETLAWNGGYDG
jgi:hypothetical protein